MTAAGSFRPRLTAAVAGALMVTVLFVAGCGDLVPGGGAGLPQRPEGVMGGMWEEAISRDPHTLDPAHGVTLLDSRLITLLFNGLVALTPGGKLVPDLAARWEMDDDGLTYTFTLRDGVKFHSGKPVTAQDVVFSFTRLLAPETASPRAWVLFPIAGAQAYHTGLAEEVAGLEALDEKTVRITLEQPLAQFLHRLTMPAAAVVDGTALQSLTGDAAGSAGTGPFRLERWERGRELVFTANHDYHWQRPYLDGIRWHIMPDRADMLQAFSEGRLHAADLTPGELRYLTDSMGWSGPLQKVTLPAVYYLALNNQAPPLSDPLARMAIHLAIDRDDLLRRWLPRGYVPAQGAIPPGIPGHNPDRRLPGYDPLQARQLLTQAGLGNGFTLTITQTPSAAFQQLGRELEEMLGKVGIQVELRTLSSKEFYEAIDRGEAQAFIISWYADYPDGENFLYPLFHSSNWGAAGNRARFASPEVDLLLTEIHGVQDEERRVDLYRQVEDAVFKALPWVPLFHPVRYHVTQPQVKNYRPVGYYQGQRLWSVWLEEGNP